MKRIALNTTLAAIAFATATLAQDDDQPSPARLALARACDARYDANTNRFAGDPARFIARGVLADKTARTVTLDATTTGVGPSVSARLMREPVTSTLSSVLALAVPDSVVSADAAADAS